MILIDSRPLVALFDPRDRQHRRCVRTLAAIREPIATTTLSRAFELMEVYADHPMDLADASLVTAAESLVTRKIFTMHRHDFQTYRVRRGHRYYPFEIIA